MSKYKKGNIYRKAAVSYTQGPHARLAGACYHLSEAICALEDVDECPNRYENSRIVAFGKLFTPDESLCGGYFWPKPSDERLLALHFAAAMYETGDL